MGPVQKRNTRKIVALSLLACLMLSVGFVFAPMQSAAAARQALASRFNASPTGQKIISITPAPIRSLVRRQFEPVTIVANATSAPISTLSAVEAGLGGELEVAGAMAITSITQTVLGTSPFCAGTGFNGFPTTAQYQIQVVNDGVADTNAVVTFRSPLSPANWTLSSFASDAGFSCGLSMSNTLLTCTAANFAANATATITVNVAIPANTAPGTNFPNQNASFVSTETTTIAAAGGTAGITTQSCLNLTLTKTRAAVSNTGGTNNLVAGSGPFDDIDYTISINNAGPSTALVGQLNVMDTLTASSANLQSQLVASAVVGGTFSAGCTTATLFSTGCNNALTLFPASSTRAITYSVQVGPDVETQCETIQNSAVLTVVGDGVVNLGMGATTAMAPIVNVVSRATMAFPGGLTNGPANAYSGQTITYNTTLRHQEIPVLTLDSSTIYGGVMRFNLPTLPIIGGLNPISAVLAITPAPGWTCTPEVNPLGPTFIDCEPPPPPLGIPGLAPVSAANDDFPFTFVVKTNSLLPNGTILAASSQWTPPPSGNCDSGAQTNSPTSATVNTTIIAEADLGILKVANPGSVTAGGGDPAGKITYILTVGNNPEVEPGSDAVNVLVSDNVPGNVTVFSQPVFVQTGDPVQYPGAMISVICSAAAPGVLFTCTPGDNTMVDPSYVPGVWPKGLTGTITYEVLVPANVAPGTIIGNTASINSNQAGQEQPTPDPNSGNNVSLTTTTLVTGSADLAMIKERIAPNSVPQAGSGGTVIPNDPVNAGELIAYRLTVTNNGPSVATDIAVEDDIPPNMIFISVNASSANVICTAPPPGQMAGTISCTRAVSNVGNSDQIFVVFRVNPGFLGASVTNIARVRSALSDPDGSNNNPSVTTAVEQLANFSITKSVSPTTVVAGDNVTYTIQVINQGPSAAQNVVVTDNWTSGQYQFVSATGTGPFSAPGSCVNTGAPDYDVICTAGGLFPPGLLATITIVFQVNPDAGPVQPGTPNVANIKTSTFGNATSDDDGPGLDSNGVQHAVVRQPDLQIVKTGTPDPVVAGQNITYTLAIKNNGISTALVGEVNVTDPLPANTTAVSVVGTGPFAGCSIALLNGLGCVNSTAMPPDATATITFVVAVNANFPLQGVVSNTATVTVTIPAPFGFVQQVNGDPDLSNNQSTVTTTVLGNADLQITKTALTIAGGVFGAQVTAGGTVISGTFGPGNVGSGEIEYTLAYSNVGPSDAANVHIRDVIPAGTLLDPTFVPIGVVVTPTTGPPLTCDLLQVLNQYQLDCTPDADVTNGNTAGVLPAGSAGTIQFAVRVAENVLDGVVIKNQATIASDSGDANPSNNVSNETQNVVRARADLEIAKTAPVDVLAGSQINYGLQVTNNGPSNAQSVVVKDTLPAGVSFVSATSPDAGVSCSHDGGVVTCTKTTFIAPAINPPPIIPPQFGSNVFNINIVGLVDPALAVGTVLNNNATVSAATEDTVPGNNAIGASTTVFTNADVTIQKSDSPDPVVAGTNLTYTITVNNAGPSNAGQLVVTDALPAGTSFVSVSGTGPFSVAGACTHNGAVPGSITCNGGNFPPGSQTITLVVKVDSGYPNSSIQNTASVTWFDSNGTDTEVQNGPVDATAFTDVIRLADLALDKSSDSGPWIAGSNIDFTIKLSNLGPSDVLGGQTPGSIVVTDTLPTGTTLANVPNNVVVAGPGGFTCQQTNGEVVCLNAAGAAGNFPAGAMTTIILKLTIPSNVPAGGNYCNTATVEIDPDVDILEDPGEVADLDAVDPNPGNNTDTACVIVSTSADLGLSKTATPVVDPDGAGPLVAVPLPTGPGVPAGGVSAGGYIRYDVPFANAGPSDSINVTLTDAVPANSAFVGALATGGVFVPAAQPPAIPFNFTIGATHASTGPISLACTVINPEGSQQLRCSPGDNTGVDPTYVAGTLPAGYSGTLVFFVRVNAAVAGGTVVHNAANITSGPGSNPPPPGPAEENGVNQIGSTPDPNTSNNTSLPIPTIVVSSSNLTVTKIVQSGVTSASNPNQTGPIGPATPPNGAVATGTAVLPGTVLTYRVTVTNNGPSDASNIQLTDILPSGLETPPGRVLGVKYISVNPVPGGPLTWVCQPPTGINPANNPQGNGGQLQCTAQGALSAVAPNNTSAIDVTVFIDPATKANLVNTATISGTMNGFNGPIGGSAVLTTPVAATSDLALTKTHTTPVVAGLEFNYTVTLTNNGPSAAQMVSMVDTLPPFQTVTNISIAQSPNGNGAPNFSCNTVGMPQVVTCTAAELPPNKNADGTVNASGTVVFTIRVLQAAFTPQPSPPYQNCVTATSMSTDPVPANNTNICDTVNVTFSSDVQAATFKTDTPDPVIAGENLTYVIEVPNPGPSDALDLTITDPLPAGVVFLSAVAPGATTLTTPPVGTNGTVTAVWAGLTPVGTTRTLTIVVRVCPEVLCNTVLVNTATASSGTPDPNLPNNPGTAETTVQTRAELSITKSVTPNPVKPSLMGQPPSNVTYTLNFANAGPSNAASTVITDVLPAGFEVVSVVSTTPGMTFSQAVGGPTGDQVTLTINLGTIGAANQCATSFPTSGTVTIVARVPNKFPNVFVTNTATIASGNCLPELNTADNTASVTHEVATEPLFQTVGLPFPAKSEASDDKAGSVLFFPLYTSNASLPGSQNTRISISNVSQTDPSIIHLFVVDGQTCSAQDVFICLTPNQTITFRSSDFDPNITGYIVAVAVNPNTGIPMACNFLIGDAYVKFSSGHSLSYGAVAVSALQLNPAGVDQTATQATLKFDGVHYNRLPRQLAASSIASPGDSNSTMIALHAVGGNMSHLGATLGSLTGNLFDDRENNYSFNEPAPNCQFRRVLSDNFPRTFVPFSAAITPGHTGWMKIRAFNDVAILGVQINYNPNTAISGQAFNQGHVLHTMTLTNSATLTVPVDFPGC
ncbi:MAG: DUF11 domain-containing protein [Acidobacteria bacterium]|nr:DUF11 domain-containing protein [Acidobacteriota bacterium]